MTSSQSWDKSCVSVILGKPSVREYGFLRAANIVIAVEYKTLGLGICGYPNGLCVVDTRTIYGVLRT